VAAILKAHRMRGRFPMLKMLLLALLVLAGATDMPTPEGLTHPEPVTVSSAALQG
jgi:hypothetical protein